MDTKKKDEPLKVKTDFETLLKMSVNYSPKKEKEESKAPQVKLSENSIFYG